jgi:hypothetical protein
MTAPVRNLLVSERGQLIAWCLSVSVILSAKSYDSYSCVAEVNKAPNRNYPADQLVTAKEWPTSSLNATIPSISTTTSTMTKMDGAG